MKLQEALKIVNAHFMIYNFIAEHTYLFSDTALKVFLTLSSTVDYNFKSTIAVMSYPKISQKTWKKISSIQKAIEELESKGFIIKTSGKKDKALARYNRQLVYQKKQRPVRSYNEINTYDIRNFIILVACYYKFLEFYPKHKDIIDEIINNVVFTAEKQHINLIELLSYIFDEYLQPSKICLLNIDKNIDEIYTNCKSEEEIYINCKSDLHNMQIRFTQICKSDLHNLQKTISSHQETNDIYPLSHNQSKENERECDKYTEKEEKKKENENKERKKLQDNHNMTQISEINTTLDRRISNNNIPQEFWRFIMADLHRKERLGLIRSAEAVAYSLMKNPEKLVMYDAKYQQYVELIKDLKVLKFHCSAVERYDIDYVFQTDVSRMIEGKLEKGTMVFKDDNYLMVAYSEACEEYIERANEIGINMELEEYVKYEGVFIEGILDVFFPVQHSV